MRVAVAGFALESVSFLPDLVTFEDFEKLALRGGALIDALAGTATTRGGFIAELTLPYRRVPPGVFPIDPATRV